MLKIYICIFISLLHFYTVYSSENQVDSLKIEESYIDSFPMLEDLDLDTKPVIKVQNEKKKPQKDSLSNSSWNDYYKNNFNPFKSKAWHVNLVLNFSDQQESNQHTILVDISERAKQNIGVGVSVGYFFKNYMSTGLNFVYNRNYSDLDYLSEADTINNKSLYQEFIFTPFLRNYIPLTDTERFSVFNETGLSFGYGQNVTRTIQTIDAQEKYYAESYIVKLGIKPGINAFIVEKFAFEVSIDLIGFSLEHLSSEKNEELPGEVKNINFDFKVDLLSTNFGVAYYF